MHDNRVEVVTVLPNRRGASPLQNGRSLPFLDKGARPIGAIKARHPHAAIKSGLRRLMRSFSQSMA